MPLENGILKRSNGENIVKVITEVIIENMLFIAFASEYIIIK